MVPEAPCPLRTTFRRAAFPRTSVLQVGTPRGHPPPLLVLDPPVSEVSCSTTRCTGAPSPQTAAGWQGAAPQVSGDCVWRSWKAVP